MKNNSIEQSVLKELYELNNWPDIEITLSNIKNNNNTFIKIDAPGNYIKNTIYYGTNNKGIKLKNNSLFLSLEFIDYSSIDNFPIFRLLKIPPFRALIEKDGSNDFKDEDEKNISISDIFNGKNSIICDKVIQNKKIIPISKNITSRAFLVLYIEDHIQGY